MKKIISSLFVGSSLVASLLVGGQESQEVYSIVEDKGYFVVDDDTGSEWNQTILCQTYDLSVYGFEGKENEYVCENVFDDLDFTIIEHDKTGDLLLVTVDYNNNPIAVEPMDKSKAIKLDF